MATESEYIERAALVDLHAAAPPGVAADLRLALTESGSSLVSVAGALPSSAIVVNRTVGFGLDGNTGDDALERIRDQYRAAGVERFFLALDPSVSDDEVRRMLEVNGLVKARGWQKFRRGREAAAGVESDLQVRLVGPEHGVAFGRIVAEGFGLGEKAGAWLAGLPGCENWHVFMSFDGDEPAGAGAVYVSDEIAWTDFAATRAEYRRRRSQGALLAARIAYALDLGCRQIFTCTGEAAAGDEQHSYRNILRAGFEADYLRENYAPESVA